MKLRKFAITFLSIAAMFSSMAMIASAYDVSPTDPDVTVKVEVSEIDSDNWAILDINIDSPNYADVVTSGKNVKTVTGANALSLEFVLNEAFFNVTSASDDTWDAKELGLTIGVKDTNYISVQHSIASAKNYHTGGLFAQVGFPLKSEGFTVDEINAAIGTVVYAQVTTSQYIDGALTYLTVSGEGKLDGKDLVTDYGINCVFGADDTPTITQDVVETEDANDAAVWAWTTAAATGKFLKVYADVTKVGETEATAVNNIFEIPANVEATNVKVGIVVQYNPTNIAEFVVTGMEIVSSAN